MLTDKYAAAIGRTYKRLRVGNFPPFSNAKTQTSHKMHRDLNIRMDAIKTSEVIAVKFHVLVLANEFLGMIPKA